MTLDRDAFEQAAERLAPLIHHTELDHSVTFSKMAGGNVYLKCENRQRTGSFKIRGAGNKIASLIGRGERNPVVASSAGNHAQGVAYAASRFGIPATIVMPTNAPIAKIQATEGYGAKVVLTGTCYDDTYEEALRIARDENATFLHPYDDEEVIAGQGTIGLEILRDLPGVDTIVVPAGGGGLLSGVAAAVKQMNPRVRIIGVQAEGADAIARSFRAKKRVVTQYARTIADGIAVKAPGKKTVELINEYVDDVVTVSDTEIADAILLLIERCKQVVEPAGASSLAAILSKKIDTGSKRCVAVLSGGNIDVSFIESIIERGLVARGRRIKFLVRLLDRPGSLISLLSIIAKDGANVLTVEHDKLVLGLNPNETSVHIACEVGGKDHSARLLKDIEAAGFTVEIEE